MRLHLILANLITLVIFCSATSRCNAAVVVSTSFEQEDLSSRGGIYIDTGDALTDHALVNNDGQMPVNSTVAAPGLLGFSAEYINTRDGDGLTDGDFVGVTNFTGDVGAYTDGVQGYQLQDTDGLMRLNFDTVDISGLGDITITIDAFVHETPWESNDRFRIFATVDGSKEIDLLDTTGSDIDDLGIEGAWNQYSTTISGMSAALSVELDSNAASESVYLDNVVFQTTAIPEPSTAAALMFGMLGLAIGRRRTRR